MGFGTMVAGVEKQKKLRLRRERLVFKKLKRIYASKNEYKPFDRVNTACHDHVFKEHDQQETPGRFCKLIFLKTESKRKRKFVSKRYSASRVLKELIPRGCGGANESSTDPRKADVGVYGFCGYQQSPRQGSFSRHSPKGCS